MATQSALTIPELGRLPRCWRQVRSVMLSGLLRPGLMLALPVTRPVRSIGLGNV